MTTVGLIALLSLVCVGGLCLAVSGWVQPAPSLTRTLRHLRRAPVPSAGSTSHEPSAARWVASKLGRYPALLPSDVQLRLVGRSPAGHAGRLCLVVLGGLIVPGALITTLQLAGLIGLQWFVPFALSLVC